MPTTRNIAAESDEELVYGCELFWGADVQGDGARIERGAVVATRVAMLVVEIIQTFRHSCKGRLEFHDKQGWGETHADHRQD